VAGLDGARSFVPGPGPAVLPLIALGFLWMLLWQGRSRALGAVPVIAAFALWMGQDRPLGLIAEGGTLVGVMTPEGRALSKDRGAGFVARNWLENDGDAVPQEEAYARWPTEAVLPGGQKLAHLSGKRAAEAFQGCGEASIVVTTHVLENVENCDVYDPTRLRKTGAIAIYGRGAGLRMVSVRDKSGDRLWSLW
jgi:competence protein ComEC